ncbi:MFS general substrate transporter [Ascobolus immersus RN42]|uniref:MFS general substrate transporter n=1 Tax=Ascobolus immersus RN42 TaxID=1160509 RepID=A0A3N4HNA4_ASCIM|nr:MFS general substrate transporter [Ascobolus immersus RN42]
MTLFTSSSPRASRSSSRSSHSSHSTHSSRDSNEHTALLSRGDTKGKGKDLQLLLGTGSSQYGHGYDDDDASQARKDMVDNKAVMEERRGDAELADLAEVEGKRVEVSKGVEKAEAMAVAWGKWGLYVAYLGLFTGSIIVSLEGMTTFTMNPAATSAFKMHHVLSTMIVVQSVLMATVKPPIAKIADVFGRLEALMLSLVFSVLGFVMRAAAQNLNTFAGAQVFAAAGSTGLQIFTQIFVADTTTLLNRALFSSLPDIPFLFTAWAGPALAEAIGPEDNWRWGFGIFAILMPLAFLPLVGALVYAHLRAKRLRLLPPSPYKGKGALTVASNISTETDMLGLLLLTAGLILLFVPLTLTGPGKQWQWADARTLALLIVGILLLGVFALYETSRFCPKPMFHWPLFRDRTIAGAILLAFFYFAVFYLANSYFFTWQQVVRNSSTKEGTTIQNIFSFSSSVSSIIISMVLKYTGNYKWPMMAGIPIYVLGYGLMILFRTHESTTVQIVLAQILVGAGGGAINVPAQVGLQAAAGHANVAMATAMFLTMISVGGAVGSAIAGAIWSNLLPGSLDRHLEGLPSAVNATLIYGDYFKAMIYPAGSVDRLQIGKAYSEVYRIQLIVACCFAVPMIPLGLWMRNIDLRTHDTEGVKGFVLGAGDKPVNVKEEEAVKVGVKGREERRYGERPGYGSSSS